MPKDIDAELVRKLAGLLDETGLGEIEYSIDNWKIRVVKHTSISIRDAISIFSQNNKFIEVHISDINKREDFRQINLIKEFSEHSIIGQGVEGYMKALEYIDGQ